MKKIKILLIATLCSCAEQSDMNGQLSNIVDFQQSDEFRDNNLRCATPENEPTGYEKFEPADCSSSMTRILPEYDPRQLCTIRIVFHVVMQSDGVGHISEEMIRSQVDILNEDFRAMEKTPGEFGVDSRIQFELASVEPTGGQTSGVNYYTNDIWFLDPGPYNHSSMKESINWDPRYYLNIYTNNGALTLGYASPPQNAGNFDDGVVLNWMNVGRNAPMGGLYDMGRTATHEVGHYLGLSHTFRGGCGDPSSPYTTGDLIADTVPEANASYGCTTSVSACGSGYNPVDNYMNYSDDSCMTHFTPEQVNRMRCSLMNYRLTLAGTPTL